MTLIVEGGVDDSLKRPLKNDNRAIEIECADARRCNQLLITAAFDF
jgi:hypothetical protein